MSKEMVMKILSSEVQLASERQYKRTDSVETHYTQTFSQILGERSEAENGAATRRERLAKMLEQLVESILAAMEGRKCRSETPDCRLPELPEARSGREVEFKWSVSEKTEESEATSVSGCGKVQTADGRCLDFDFALAMSRESSHSTKFAGEGKMELQDPLILNFSGQAAELDGQKRIDFDLDADGRAEKIPGLSSASGYLVIDSNHNGRADDGKELFGTTSGDGFADLKAYDRDGNGWIDENDPAFADLRIWRGGSASGELSTLQAQGVGAIWLGSVDSAFSRKDAAGQMLGEIRATGLFLNENGSVGSVQQVDLAVDKSEPVTDSSRAGRA